jgi:hypothetical protein
MTAAFALAGFTVWHLAPQLVLPSSHGRAGFLLGAAAVGAASTAAAWRTGGLRQVRCRACSPTPAAWGLPASGSAVDDEQVGRGDSWVLPDGRTSPEATRLGPCSLLAFQLSLDCAEVAGPGAVHVAAQPRCQRAQRSVRPQVGADDEPGP